MLISYNWLRELTGTRLLPQELRERLTMVGLAIDAIEEHESDAVLDVEVPSNRPDCLSHIGIAREVAVIEGTELILPPDRPATVSGSASQLTKVDIADPELCPRYAARLVRGVKIGPSPAWLVAKLESIGQRPINNVADITNYVLHELGQPLHAFDFHRLSGRQIVVRRATEGELLKTLDGVERKLSAEMLVIADEEKAVALAGIMGGEDSEISTSTRDVLIESAYFNPDSIRRTARALGMDTEASRRFERGADIENILRAQQRTVELICELAGGIATEDAIDVYPRPVAARKVTLRTNRIAEITSLRVDPDAARRILIGLGFLLINEIDQGATYQVPSWRIDVEQEEDLVEEVARHTGYDKIGSELPPSSASGEYQPVELKLRVLRRALNSVGFDEAINFSFVAEQEGLELIPAFRGMDEVSPRLLNPIIEGASQMRQTLVPGLLTSIRHNLNHGIRDIHLFEIGRVFAQNVRGELPKERLALGLASTGGLVSEGRAQADREIDFFDLKGALETAVSWMNFPALSFQAAAIKHLRLGQAAEIRLDDGKLIGSLGRLSEDISGSYKFRQPVYVLELDLSELFETSEQLVQYAPLPRYPSVVRDLSLLMDRSVTLQQIVDAVKAQNIHECSEVKFVGTYEGANIPAGKRSLTLRIQYRSEERTLRDDDVEQQHSLLTNALLAKFGAEQR